MIGRKANDLELSSINSVSVDVCVCVCVRSVAQSCSTLCNPMDYSPPGSSVHGIFQARILEWVAISSFRDLPNPGIKPVSCYLLYWEADSLPPHHLGSPVTRYSYLISHSIPNINGTKSFRVCVTSQRI